MPTNALMRSASEMGLIVCRTSGVAAIVFYRSLAVGSRMVAVPDRPSSRSQLMIAPACCSV
jgi:hypothetical protein